MRDAAAVEKQDFEGDGLVMYLGDRIADVPKGYYSEFIRGVPKTINDPAALGLLKTLFPDYQVLNKGKIYIGSGCTVDDFDVLKNNMTADAEILFIRDVGLGDVILSIPTVNRIRLELPAARITYATNPGYFPLFYGLDLVDELIPVQDADIQSGKYDAVINWCRCLEHYDIPRNRGRRVDSYAKMLGLYPLGEDVITPTLAADDISFVDGLAVSVPGPYICYVLQAAAWNRTYPVWRAREVLEQLHRQFPDHKIIILDNQPGFGLFNGLDYVISMGGKTTIMQAAAIMKRSDVVVTPDTGMAHLSASLGVTTLVLLSTQPFEWRYDHYGNHIQGLIKEDAAPCVPCNDWQRRDMEKFKPGQEPIRYCMRDKKNHCLLEMRPDEIAARARILFETVNG
mgnify:FL=1